jgi:hypothetical protein
MRDLTHIAVSASRRFSVMGKRAAGGATPQRQEEFTRLRFLKR